MICIFCGDFCLASENHECSYYGSNYQDYEEADYEGTAWWCDMCGKFLDATVSNDSFERPCDCGIFARPTCAENSNCKENVEKVKVSLQVTDQDYVKLELRPEYSWTTKGSDKIEAPNYSDKVRIAVNSWSSDEEQSPSV
jgi:hypothetical protein